MNRIRSSVTPEGKFIYGIHKPQYTVTNLRDNTHIQSLGHIEGSIIVDNARNFPEDDINVTNADWIFEIPNPFPFKGVTYIDKEWADATACDYSRIRIKTPEPVSFSELLQKSGSEMSLLQQLPEPMQLALATCSTDPKDLIQLAEISCKIEKDDEGRVTGLGYRKNTDGSIRPVMHKHMLFEAVANNPHLPQEYKVAMVLRPGAQGGSEIVGEIPSENETHVYEYLRRNSYIAGGHYAANMAEDASRYSIQELSQQDMDGLRHLYYQRIYVRLAKEIGINAPEEQRKFTNNELEDLRNKITVKLKETPEIPSTATLWGWNFGFDYAPSKYRLHASHQQIHQQYAMIPESVEGYTGNLEASQFSMETYGCGDLVAEVIRHYRAVYNREFFVDYLSAIENNTRMDERTVLESSLIVWRDENVIVFVPKAQTSQWELQLMTIDNKHGMPTGNILEADSSMRNSLNRGIFAAQKALAGIGAKMVTSIEYPKRIGKRGEPGQPLMYAFLPRLPESPGAFSEAQLRFINGTYPEDFAAVLRTQLLQYKEV
ncbi:hypothetical protein [Desulfosediminicola flagellatus]|uniref:hypothetical protein n=1 Tax=Desulfosediminicola flagellatus TaxID=2569541 RepID=UPI0010AB51BA|nr:hypothetical protein [Desulfosediminicola flagellatus]